MIMIDDQDITIRAAVPGDAEAISAMIHAALRQTNTQDYPVTIIDRLAHSYSAPRVAVMIRQREMFVADQLGLVIGTIGYAAGAVRSLFVAPNFQSRGIGRNLIAAVEDHARHEGMQSLTVAASLTAMAFYRRCGFTDLRPVDPSGIAMMLMHKRLTTSGDQPLNF